MASFVRQASASGPPVETSLLDTLVLSLTSRFAPRWIPGVSLHHHALSLAEMGDLARAEALLETAARAYREELAIEALARLRVHQAMIRVRAEGGEPGDSPLLFGVVQAVQRLERLERLESPHELDDARTVLADWLGDGPSARAA